MARRLSRRAFLLITHAIPNPRCYHLGLPFLELNRNDEAMSEQDAKLASLLSRLNEPSTSSAHTADAVQDDEDIFAELEAEIENDSSAAFREHGMEQLKRE